MGPCEVCLQILSVFGPRHLTDTRRDKPLQAEEARSQSIDAYVMEERSQLTLFVPGNGFPKQNGIPDSNQPGYALIVAVVLIAADLGISGTIGTLADIAARE